MFLASAMWVWILGVGSYYLIPSLGPFASDPGDFAALPETAITRTQTMYLDQRAHLLANPRRPRRLRQHLGVRQPARRRSPA